MLKVYMIIAEFPSLFIVLHWVLKPFVHQGASLSQKITRFFFFTFDELKKKINFCYFIRETKCVEFPHLKKNHLLFL